MNSTAMESVSDMVNLWRVWHKLSDCEMVKKIYSYENCAYPEVELSKAKDFFCKKFSK